MKVLTKIFLMIIAIAIVIGYAFHRTTLDNATSQHIKSLGYTVKSFESHSTTFNTPFFYVNKGYMIYEVHCLDKDGKAVTVWSRNGLLSNDYEIKK